MNILAEKITSKLFAPTCSEYEGSKVESQSYGQITNVILIIVVVLPILILIIVYTVYRDNTNNRNRDQSPEIRMFRSYSEADSMTTVYTCTTVDQSVH